MKGTLTITARPINGTARFSWQVDGYPEPYLMAIEPAENDDGFVLSDSSDADPFTFLDFRSAWLLACTTMAETVQESIEDA